MATGALVIALSTTASGAASDASGSADSRAQRSLAASRVTAPDHLLLPTAAFVVYGERCKSARLATAFYRQRTWDRQAARGGALADRTPIVRSKTCRWARYAADEWQARARSAKRTLTRHLSLVSQLTLRDFPFAPGNHAWQKAVAEVQRVFPGTESWLLSCSAAEGGHGRWVGYSGVSYSTALRDSDTVGGPLQFRFSTFTGMYRRGVDYVVGRGYRVPRMDMTTAWRSALGQAIAGGWARYTGNDDSHWSASWSRGC